MNKLHKKYPRPFIESPKRNKALILIWANAAVAVYCVFCEVPWKRTQSRSYREREAPILMKHSISCNLERMESEERNIWKASRLEISTYLDERVKKTTTCCSAYFLLVHIQTNTR